MKPFVLVGILAGGLASGALASQASPVKARPANPLAKSREVLQASPGALLGTIRLPRAVKANNEALPAGTYQLRLSDDEVKPAPGASPQGERWVEFLQGGKVKGREVASIVSNAEIGKLAEDRQAPPPAGSAKVQMLKGNDYVRVWISKDGKSYLIHLRV